MTKHTFFLILFASVFRVFLIGECGAKSSEIGEGFHVVEIQGLGSIKGKKVQTAENISGDSRVMLSFTGIPYGTIPKRFSPAQLRVPLVNSTPGEIYDATQPQTACWQVPSPLVEGPFTEDCLSLNVYTPKISGVTDVTLLPVIFFIHGGQFNRWSGNMFDGRRLLNRDVVVVTVNYRVNIFGFFCLENDSAPGNLALYDLILALKWVNQFISNFGGDPNRVTIAGQSAGAALVMYLFDSPLARGLFHGGISSSGDDIVEWAIEHKPLDTSLRAASMVGCNKSSLSDTLECMRTLQPEVLLNTIASGAFRAAPAVQNFPLSFEKTTPVIPIESSRSGSQTSVPLMIGGNKNDGSFLLSRVYSTLLSPKGLVNNSLYMRDQFLPALLKGPYFGIPETPWGLHDTVINSYLGSTGKTGDFSRMAHPMFTDFLFKAPAFTTAKEHSKGSDTYLYSFDYEGVQTLYPFTGGVPEVPRGVAHVDDLMYVFYFGEFSKTRDKKMSSIMVDFYTNFATTGNPNGQSLHNRWPKFTTEKQRFLKINSIPTVEYDYLNSFRNADD